MKDAALVYPMLAMVVLTACVLSTLFRRRTRAVKRGQLSSRFFRVYQGEVEPEEAAKATRQFANLFEAPVLFYVACLTAIATRQVTVLGTAGVGLRGSQGRACLHPPRCQPLETSCTSLLCELGCIAGVVDHDRLGGRIGVVSVNVWPLRRSQSQSCQHANGCFIKDARVNRGVQGHEQKCAGRQPDMWLSG